MNTSNIQKTKGFTLIELMVSLVLGLILTTSIVQFFLANHQSARVAEAFSRVQENGRSAMEFITRDIRAADYQVCVGSTIPMTAIAGTDDEGLYDSDSITIKRSEAPCKTPITDTTIKPREYAIKDGTSLSEDGVSKIPSLFVGDDELVEGIENLQILYGADTDAPKDGSPNYYVKAGTPGLVMLNVVSIRISLVAVTLEDNVALQTLDDSYVFGEPLNPPETDRKVRRVFTSTIALRNR